MQDHAKCDKSACKHADAETDGIDNSIDKRMKSNAEKRYEPDGVIRRLRLIAHIRSQEPIEEKHQHVAGEQIRRRVRIHREGLWNNVQEGDGNQHACGEAGEIGRVFFRPILKLANGQDAARRDRAGKQAGAKRNFEAVFYSLDE